MLTPANEMRSHLDLYLTGQCSLEQFEDWFAPVLRDVHKLNDPEAEGLANAIEWAFCDLERGVPPGLVRRAFLKLAEEPKQPVDVPQLQESLSTSGKDATTVVTENRLSLGNTFCGWSSGASTKLHVGLAVSLPQMRVLPERVFG